MFYSGKNSAEMVTDAYMNMNITNSESSIPFGPPTTLDIVIPPSIFIIFIVISIVLLSVITQPRWWRNRCCTATPVWSVEEDTPVVQAYPQVKTGWCDVIPESPNLATRNQSKDPLPNGKHVDKKEDTFFSGEDIDVLIKIEEFQNNPMSLICICIPVLASLAFCPVTIVTYGMWMNFFWPLEITGPMTNINDAIACFLMPAGLVYAIAFGFAFQDVLAKKADVEKSLCWQMALLHQTNQLLKCSGVIKESAKQAMARDIKDAIICWMAQLLSVKKLHNKGNLWEAVTTLQIQQSQHPPNNDRKTLLDDTIVQSIYNNLLQLDTSLSNGLQKGNRSINCLQWLFLELLGFISFFGILMVKAGSYRLELTMCILTVFSISAFSYILADLDNSYHGVFRLNLMPHIEFVKSLNMKTRSKKYELLKH